MVSFIKRSKEDIYSKPISGFVFKNQKFLKFLRITIFSLFVYAIYLGFADSSKDNTFTTALFWGIFWSLFMVTTLPTFGRIFCGICPHGFIGKYITKLGLKKTMPKWLQNRYIGIVLLVFGWWGVYYMFPTLFRTPQGTAILFATMTLLSFVIYFLYKDMSYCKYICPIGTLTKAYSKLSFTWLGTYKNACNECKTFDCAKACSFGLSPFNFDKKNSMSDCTLCMDCSSACEAVSFKYKKPSFSLFSKFKPLKAEIWVYIFILAAIPISMSFHHAIGRSNAANQMIWSKTAEYFRTLGDFGSIDLIGLFAFTYAMLFTIAAAIIGMFIASKILKKDFNSTFYNLGYSYAPLFILSSIAHTLEMFFIKDYKHILEGFAYGFGFSIDVSSLAQRGDGWLHVFGLLKWTGIIWAFIILYKRMKKFDSSKLRKIIAFPFAASLILFVIGINIYTGYIFSTYGKASRGHNHGGGKIFQSVSKDKAILLQSGKEKESCSVCGMNLPMFYKTNHTAKHKDKTKQYCSIHCLVEDKNIKKTPLSDLKVVDVNSLKFIDATQAFYVVGSRLKGTMSEVSKYAFLDKKEAIKFSKKHGGSVLSFQEAQKVALQDFTNEIAKNVSAIDIVYFTDTNPMAKKNSKKSGHMHGGSRGRIPSKTLWPIFKDKTGDISCLKNINANLYLLDTNLKTFNIAPSKDKGCKTVKFKMPYNGYYNLFYINKTINNDTLYISTAKYEYLRFNHSSDAIYDEEKMSAHSIKEIPFDILRLREKNETFYHRLYSGNKLRIKTILHNKPIENASLTLTTKSGWSKTLKTNKEGIAVFTLLNDYFPKWNQFEKRHKNKFTLTASYSSNQNGKYKNNTYSNIKYTTTYPSLYYPGTDGYKSYSYGLTIGIVTFILSGFIIYWYRKRRQKPFQEVSFDEKN